MSAGEFQSKQKIEDNISISCRADYTVTVTQTKLPQSQIDFREIINCFFCGQDRTWDFVPVSREDPTFSLSLNGKGHLSQSRPRNPSN